MEAILTVLGMMILLPRFGLWGGAWLVATLMVINRAVIVCLLASRELEVNPVKYALQIYALPTAFGTAAFLFLLAIKRAGIAGHNWREIISAGLLMGIPYVALVYRFCLAGHHRELIRDRVLALVRPR
jgi:hypothetical protein